MNTQTMRGISLIEILVTLAITSVLMLGVMTVMTSSKRTYALQDELAKLQENARFIMDDITFSLRMAGYFGCSGQATAGAPAGWNFNPVVATNDSDILNRTNGVESGFIASDNNALKSDILVVNYFNSQLRRVNVGYEDSPGFTREQQQVNTSNKADMAKSGEFGLASSNTIILAADNQIPQNVIISDCGGSRFYNVAGVTAAPGYLTTPIPAAIATLNLAVRQPDGTPQFGRTFSWPVDIFTVEDPNNVGISNRYEVRRWDNNDNNNVRFALFKNGNAPANNYTLPFVDGVQNLQIRYGMDTDGNGIANIYRTTNVAATPNERLVSVRITLLMRTAGRRFDIDDTDNKNFVLDPSPDVLAAGANVAGLYAYNPETALHKGKETGYRHRLFTSTIRVRNN